MSTSTERLTVQVRSPFVYSLGWVGAVSLGLWEPLNLFPTAWLGQPGWILLFAGALLFTWAWRTMRSQNVNPNYGRVNGLVTDGPFTWSRNPLYVGLTLAYLGAAFISNSGWMLVMLPLVLAYMRYSIISKEEAHLEQLFGQEFLDYKSRVRRWL